MYHVAVFDRTDKIRILILTGFLLFAVIIWWPQGKNNSTSKNLIVRFLDVGQGDSVHIITPDGYELLIDGGPTNSVLRELSKGRSFFDKKIDMVVATHPDTDHVSGLTDVFRRFTVNYVFETNVESDTPASLSYRELARQEGAQIIRAEAGQIIQLGASTTVYIFSPHSDTRGWETNNASIVAQVVYGETTFMLTGDAPSSIEEYLVGRYGASLHSNVLKLGHHGSNTSSSEKFLDAVMPQYAVVSAAADNRYGHPHREVTERVTERGIEMVSTIEKGTIEFISDGTKVWLIE